jgi:hypothetical protein
MSNDNRTSALVEGKILTYQQDREYYQLQVGTPEWYAWLQSATRFRVCAPFGTFTVRREQAGNQRGNWYWRAYRKHGGKLHRVYLGTTEEITPERLEIVASLLSTQHIHTKEESPSFSADLQANENIMVDSISQLTKNVRVSVFGYQSPSSLFFPLTALIGREQEVIACVALL